MRKLTPRLFIHHAKLEQIPPRFSRIIPADRFVCRDLRSASGCGGGEAAGGNSFGCNY